MICNFNKKDIVIGLSACLKGEKVRYDGSGKLSNFCINELGQHVTFKAYCPEVAIGLSVPRPTIRQISKDQLITVSRPDGSGDVTDALKSYGRKIAALSKSLSGFVFTAKSPSCGMERVKVYSARGDLLPIDGIGIFANEIMKANPLLPCEENGRLNDAIIRENFVARVYAYRHWQQLSASGFTKHKLTTFHSQYKYTLMSHDLVAYKSLGRLLAQPSNNIDVLANEYILGFMRALTVKATRKKHANTLAHMQGYFKNQLKPIERKELAEQIDAYRCGLMPLVVPITLIKHYLMLNPQKYLQQQSYLSPYPEQLKLRYGY
jgi:uncharacterized protein YbgA (DUF1722 family)/uncharacterized protein YbbK (DUF523 family)